MTSDQTDFVRLNKLENSIALLKWMVGTFGIIAIFCAGYLFSQGKDAAVVKNVLEGVEIKVNNMASKISGVKEDVGAIKLYLEDLLPKKEGG